MILPHGAAGGERYTSLEFIRFPPCALRRCKADRLRERLEGCSCHPSAIAIYSERGQLALERSGAKGCLVLF